MAWWLDLLVASGVASGGTLVGAVVIGGRRKPDPPHGVAIEHPDGSRTELDVIYAGRDAEGFHVWETAAAVLAVDEGDRLVVGELPSTTKLRGPLLVDRRSSTEEEAG
jgi:hypothetical protein